MRILQLTVLALTATIALNAAVVYDNLSSPSDGGDPINGVGPIYDSFTPASTGQISGLELLLSTLYRSSGTLNIGLYADNSTAPGPLITPLGTISDTSLDVSSDAVYNVSLLSNPVVDAGVRYWIGLSGNTFAEWWWSFQPGVGTSGEYLANLLGIAPNDEYGAYQMELTTAVPEPSMPVLVAGGVIVILFVIYSQRKTVTGPRRAGNSPAVPPAESKTAAVELSKTASTGSCDTYDETAAQQP